MPERYKRSTSFVLGFHGCSREVGEAVLAGQAHLVESDNAYDWLGPGVYFWEGSPNRAMQFATDAARHTPHITKGRITDPFVVGAIIDLRHCFSLFDSDALSELRGAHDAFVTSLEAVGIPVPVNSVGPDKARRELDCATFNAMHGLRQIAGAASYDTVRGAFWEGGELYAGSAISSKGHVQIAVANPECIMGYFRPIFGQANNFPWVPAA